MSTKLPPKFPVPQYIFLCLGFPASPAHPKGLYKSLRQLTSLERGDSNKLRLVLNLPAMESGSGQERGRASRPTSTTSHLPTDTGRLFAASSSAKGQRVPGLPAGFSPVLGCPGQKAASLLNNAREPVSSLVPRGPQRGGGCESDRGASGLLPHPP